MFRTHFRPILAGFICIMLYSAGTTSCAKDSDPAYVGKWYLIDSSEYNTPDSVVYKISLKLSESSFDATKSYKNDTSSKFYDIDIRKGKLDVFAETMTMTINSFSYIPVDSIKMEVVTAKDSLFKDIIKAHQIDTLSKVKFNVIQNKLLIKTSDKEISFTRE